MIRLLILSLLTVIVASQRPGAANEYFDVLGTGSKEWRLAFRGTARVGKSVYEAYMSSKGVPKIVQAACKGTNWKLKCRSHYRNNDALDNWANVKKVMFGVVKSGKIEKMFIFDGADTGPMSWFNKCGLMSASYEDINNQPRNYFSVLGDYTKGQVNRNFFINRSYGGCDKDAGWFVAIDGAKRPCKWEKKWGRKFPVFLYSPTSSYTVWDHGSVQEANAIVVFLKY